MAGRPITASSLTVAAPAARDHQMRIRHAARHIGEEAGKLGLNTRIAR